MTNKPVPGPGVGNPHLKLYIIKYRTQKENSQFYYEVNKTSPHLFSQLVFMFGHSFLQVGDLGLLLLDNTPQVFDAVVVGQLVLGHLQPETRSR